jgi:hypothetical protein
MEGGLSVVGPGISYKGKAGDQWFEPLPFISVRNIA